MNVQTFGALGNGSHDDTTAIQAAINALPTQGGTVYLPAGTYVITDAINLRNALRILGDGNSATVIYQTNTAKNGLQGTDILSLGLEDFRLSGPTTGTGCGISLTRVNDAATNYVVATNLYVRTFGSHGIYMTNGIVSSFTNVVAEINAGHGFNLVGLAGIAGTSVGFHSCFANQNGGTGFRLDTMNYSSFHACASEKQPIDYEVINCIGVTYNGCGSESNMGYSWKISGGYGNVILGGWIYANSGVGVYITGGSSTNTIIGLSDTSPTGTATAFIKTDPGTKAVISGVNNTTAFSFATGTVHQLSDAALNAYFAANLSVAGNATVSGQMNIGPDTNLYRVSAHVLATDSGMNVGGNLLGYGDLNLPYGKVVAANGFGTANTAAATTVGSVSRKMEVFDGNGVHLGWIPIYTTIT